MIVYMYISVNILLTNHHVLLKRNQLLLAYPVEERKVMHTALLTSDL